jgi:Polyketide cyclase / dehydrase and lipid transport
MHSIEKETLVLASPETIFRIYEEVEHWRAWDPDTKTSYLSNGLKLGSKGALTPAKGRRIPMEVTSLQTNRHFTVTSKTAIFRMHFDHVLTPTEFGTKVLHRVTFAGLLGSILAKILGRQLDRNLPLTLHRLKVRAEAREACRS